MDADEQEELIGLAQEVAYMIDALRSAIGEEYKLSLVATIKANWPHLPEQGEWI